MLRTAVVAGLIAADAVHLAASWAMTDPTDAWYRVRVGTLLVSAAASVATAVMVGSRGSA